jgi:hypothetical protein
MIKTASSSTLIIYCNAIYGLFVTPPLVDTHLFLFFRVERRLPGEVIIVTARIRQQIVVDDCILQVVDAM